MPGLCTIRVDQVTVGWKEGRNWKASHLRSRVAPGSALHLPVSPPSFPPLFLPLLFLHSLLLPGGLFLVPSLSHVLQSRFWNEGGSLPGLASMGRAFRTRPVWGPLQTQHRLVLPSTGNSCFPGSRHVQQDRGIEHGGFLTAVLSAGDR